MGFQYQRYWQTTINNILGYDMNRFKWEANLPFWVKKYRPFRILSSSSVKHSIIK